MSLYNKVKDHSRKIGVIDLGTNTFHLLIVSVQGAEWNEEFRLRKFVALGEEGIEKIGEAALDRAFQALQEFKVILSDTQTSIVQANGTAALRTATNGPAFLEKVRTELGISVALIDGQKEAELICKGVRQAIPPLESPALIMDIGGGSVEFIIVNQDQVIWSQSFPAGVAVLYQKFHKNDPITREESEAIEAFLAKLFMPLHEQLKQHPCSTLVGASGTFDVLEKLLATQKIGPASVRINPADFPPLFQKFIQSDLAVRLNWPGIPPQRAQLIVVALILINHVLKSQQFDHLLISKYAMKEGMIAQLLQE